MSCQNFNELKRHLGHKISLVMYGKQNVSIECENCKEVLIDYDKQEEVI